MLVALLICGNVFSQGIEFEHGTFEEALAKAKAQNKPLFMDVYTSWCGPCKKLSKQVFPNKLVGDYFNKNFVCYKLQADKNDGVSPKIAEKYKITAYPTLMWLDGDGKILHISIGYKEAEPLVEEAKIVFDEDKRVGAIVEKWNNGDRSFETAQKYFAFDCNARGEFDEYFKQLSDKEKLDALCWKMIKDVRINPESKTMEYIVRHRTEFVNVSNAWEFERTINRVIQPYIVSSYGKNGYDELLKKYADWGVENIDCFSKKGEWTKLLKDGNFSSFEMSAKEYISDYAETEKVYFELIEKMYSNLRNQDYSSYANKKIAVEWANKSKVIPGKEISHKILLIKANVIAGNTTAASEIGKTCLKELEGKDDFLSNFFRDYISDITKGIK